MQDSLSDEYFMSLALEEAKRAFDKQEVPVGAVLVKDQKVIATAHNQVETTHDPTAHAEMLCLQRASRQLNSWRLLDATLYVTLEPCSMCLGAMFLSRIKRVVWGAKDLRHGACGSWVNLLANKHPIHNLEVSSCVLEERSVELLKTFFQLRRREKVGQAKTI